MAETVCYTEGGYTVIPAQHAADVLLLPCVLGGDASGDRWGCPLLCTLCLRTGGAPMGERLGLGSMRIADAVLDDLTQHSATPHPGCLLEMTYFLFLSFH